jgi:hypothetical protein
MALSLAVVNCFKPDFDAISLICYIIWDNWDPYAERESRFLLFMAISV